MLKCACGEHIKHISSFVKMHTFQIRCVHNGLSNIGILCSQNVLALICIFDWNRLPVTELDRHYVQNDSEVTCLRA